MRSGAELGIVNPGSGPFGLPWMYRGPDGRMRKNIFRSNSVLRKQQWQELDQKLVDVGRQRLNGIADLQASRLVLPLLGIGTTVSQYEQNTDLVAADVTMGITAAGEEDRLTFTLVSIPVPVVHKDFRFDARTLDASRRFGQPLDLATAEIAARKVLDALEDILFNGAAGIVVNAAPLYGYTTHPDRNTYSGGGDWGTIANIYDTVNTAVNAAEADGYFGPYNLYVAKTQYGQMRAIYTDGSGESAMERVLRGIPSIKAIKPADVLADATAVLVQMTSDVVDLAVAADVQVIEWQSMGPLESRFKVMAVMAPRVKSDASDGSGVVHISSI